jgi:hypothetical protein
LTQLCGEIILAPIRRLQFRDYLPHVTPLNPALIVLETIDDLADKQGSGAACSQNISSALALARCATKQRKRSAGYAEALEYVQHPVLILRA